MFDHKLRLFHQIFNYQNYIVINFSYKHFMFNIQVPEKSVVSIDANFGLVHKRRQGALKVEDSRYLWVGEELSSQKPAASFFFKDESVKTAVDDYSASMAHQNSKSVNTLYTKVLLSTNLPTFPNSPGISQIDYTVPAFPILVLFSRICRLGNRNSKMSILKNH